jgi:hypothetical protein
MLAVAIPITLLTIAMVAERGGNFAFPALQIMTLVVGSIVVWRFGGRIVEGMTRIYEEVTGKRRSGGWNGRTHHPEESTRYYGESQEAAPPDSSLGSKAHCVHCGYAIPVYATFCRRCGKRQ